MNATAEILDLREAAAALGIDPWRLSRLGRYLSIDPGAKCIPQSEVLRLSREDHVEDRYCALRQWLIGSLRD